METLIHFQHLDWSILMSAILVYLNKEVGLKLLVETGRDVRRMEHNERNMQFLQLNHTEDECHFQLVCLI